MTKATPASVFIPTYSDDEARANCRTENISAARTTLGGNPVVAA